MHTKKVMVLVTLEIESKDELIDFCYETAAESVLHVAGELVEVDGEEMKVYAEIEKIIVN